MNYEVNSRRSIKKYLPPLLLHFIVCLLRWVILYLIDYIPSKLDRLLADAINTFDTFMASEVQATALKGKLNKTVDPSDAVKEPTTRKDPVKKSLIG